MDLDDWVTQQKHSLAKFSTWTNMHGCREADFANREWWHRYAQWRKAQEEYQQEISSGLLETIESVERSEQIHRKVEEKLVNPEDRKPSEGV